MAKPGKEKPDEQYTDEEAQRRFEAALRGARLVTQRVKDKSVTPQAEAQRRRREKERKHSKQPKG